MTTEETVKAFTALVALGGLLFGVYQFLRVQEIEAARPYLEKKLAWCEEAVETASAIANAEAPDPADRTRFREMYWGVMGLIENDAITQAMIGFGRILESGDAPARMRPAALALAHACRAELSREWSASWGRG